MATFISHNTSGAINEIWKIFILFSKLEADSQQKKCIQFVRQYITFQTNNIKKLLLLANLYY